MRLGPVTAGAPAPLGVRPSANGINVAVWSSAGHAVDLCLFDADGREHRVRLPERTGEVFHGHVAGVGPGARYGLRVHGPWSPASGARFDPAKLLLDPFAEAVDRPFSLHDAMFSREGEGVDSAAFMPRGVVLSPSAPCEPLTVPWERTVIYEAHVKGLTRLHPEVPEAERGTFAALAHPAVIGHLKSLGVTTLELLPAAAWIDERHLKALSLANYWGYNPVAFCAPDPRLAPGGWAEVRRATGALAAAGIETILDVVFNHSGEGDALGPTVSMRGIDNAAWYRLHPGDLARYIDDSGTGNTLALDRPPGVALVMEALRVWARRGGMAGFRFDLATALGRRPDGFDPAAPLLCAIAQDPELARLKMIAEPWDCGPGGYQLGRFPGPWGEWNDRFRDTVRGFWRGDAVPLGRLAEVLSGSHAAMSGHGRPSRSVNYVTAHDGFTLADLVSYAGKHNAANGEANRDGTDDNRSWNNGVEGPTDDPAVRARRLADQRALLALLLLARGAPMLSAGAELGQTQGGNNNAYAQDNATSWIDWAMADTGLARFTARLAAARAAHPALREDRFLTGRADRAPYHDVAWLRPDGEPMRPEDWDDPHGAALQAVLCAPEGEGLDRVCLLVNRSHRPVAATVPEARDRHAWTLVLCSADEAREGPQGGLILELAPRSLALLAEVPARRTPRHADDAALAEVAAAAGISPEWWSLGGERHVPSPDTNRALLAAMGLEVRTAGDAREALWRLAEEERRPLPWCAVLREGEAGRIRASGAWLSVIGEDGRVVACPCQDGEARLPPLAAGYYRLEGAEATGRLIVTPATAWEPDGRRVGLSAQLYSLRGAVDRGMGDFSTLAELARETEARGLGLLTANPFHALFPGDRTRASPYYPSDRRFIDPLYIDPARLAGATPTAPSRLAALPEVDYEGVWALSAPALEAAFETFRGGGGDPAFDAFVRAGGEALQRFALFQAIAEQRGTEPWSRWPDGLDDPASPASAAFARRSAERVLYHQFLQWQADRQLGEAAVAAPGVLLCRDLAVGAAPDGAEIWSEPGQFARGVSIGAPPDAFSREGQVWGMPPPIPERWRRDGFARFAELLAANMRHAGGLRVDHALGLSRLFWVPQGARGVDGAYVAYPRDEMLAVIALESRRARCLVVGEDLGTAAEGLREALAATAVYSYRVLPFERDGRAFRPPSSYPERALACVSTHDLPPLAGWWSGTDLCERRALGLLGDADLAEAEAERASDRRALVDALAAAGLGDDWPDGGALTPELAGAAHAYVAAGPSRLVAAQVEDLAGETVGVNLPGTDRERPNWRRRLAARVGELWNAPAAQAILTALRTAR